MSGKKRSNSMIAVSVATSLLTVVIIVLIIGNVVLYAASRNEGGTVKTKNDVSWDLDQESGDTSETSQEYVMNSSVNITSSIIVEEPETEPETPEETESQTEVETEAPVQQESRSTESNTNQAANNSYIIGDSNSRYLSESDLTGLTQNQLMLARNEIYARLGRGFLDSTLQTYFNNQAWYTKKYAPEEFDAMGSIFNQYEYGNINTIRAYEEKMGY